MKQVIVMRKDLNMRKGKMAAQAAHASMKILADKMIHVSGDNHEAGFYYFVKKDTPLYDWLNGIFKKVVVGVNSEEELMEVYARANAAGLLTSLITDSGATEFHGVPTRTCIAVGPDTEELVDSITGSLQLL